MPLHLLSQILLVEDSPDDAFFLQNALEESRLGNHLHLVRDGAQALAFLRRDPPFELAPRPNLVILDLNLPKIPGLEVLKAMQADGDLRRIPVVVLTTSSAEEDLLTSFQYQAAAFITKPRDLDDYENVVHRIELFWLQLTA